MKKILLFTVFISVSCFSQFKQIDITSIDEKIKEKIFDFTFNTLKVCDGGKYIPLDTNSGEKQLLEFYSIKSVTKNCEWFLERYGKVLDVKLEQVLKSGYQNLIFRFKVFRTHSDIPQECKVFYSSKGKYYGFSTKTYWDDNYDSTNKYPELYIRSIEEITKHRKKELSDFVLNSYNVCDEKNMPTITKGNTVYRSYRKGWTSLQIKECDSIKSKNGIITSLKFEQYLSDDIINKIYRFKVQFDKLSKPSEIRVYANIKDKYRGIFVIDKWYSNYLEFDEAINKSQKDLKSKHLNE
ncbi:hypothetical protein [uncultured Tenacibaculum sp.]|uniref:hypothetical protein n=1 Tax=uncultured Tenacibaculum sp. TaxID=174713 RepID=UPI002631AEBF|nr:hypothetical protein [uncultured Tenacibaculum sp.]